MYGTSYACILVVVNGLSTHEPGALIPMSERSLQASTYIRMYRYMHPMGLHNSTLLGGTAELYVAIRGDCNITMC